MSEKLTKEELIRRYVYDVARRLPQKGRADIEKELQSNIVDMLDARRGDREATPEDVTAVLRQLGKPSQLANSYKDQKRALLSGVYYDQYLFVLKIVLIAVAVGMGIAQTITYAAEPALAAAFPVGGLAGLAARGADWNIGTVILQWVAGMVNALAIAFAYVTVIFVIVERLQVKLDMGTGEWDPGELPPIPAEKAVIRKSDPIAGIVFTVIVMLLFNLAPRFFSVGLGFVHDEAGAVVTVFNMDMLQAVLPLLNICFLLGIAREVLRVVAGRYTLKLSVVLAVIGAVSLWLVMAVFSAAGLWNIAGMEGALFAAGITDPFVTRVFQALPLIFLGLLVFAYVLDIATTLYKGIRYGR